MDLFEKLMRNKLAIVDTTAAPAMYIVLLVVKLFEIYRFIMKIFTHIPYSRWDNWQETQGSMHSFSSIYTALIKTISVSRIVYSKP